MNDSLAYLRTPVAIRERAAKVLKYVVDGQSQWFQLDANGLETAVQATLSVTRERFPNPAAIRRRSISTAPNAWPACRTCASRS